MGAPSPFTRRFLASLITSGVSGARAWAEIIAVNTPTGEEACIPRSFVGDVSANAPMVIVGLKREMEWR